jgi:hypothetical protein
MNTLNVGSDGMGSWAFGFLDPLLKRTFPHTEISHDTTKKPDLVIRSHFTNMESQEPYDTPYIVWSGESQPVALLPTHAPLFELNTYYSPRPNSVYFPYLMAEIKETKRPTGVQATDKKFCASYAFSNHVRERETLFLYMRQKEPTCYSFGRSCLTKDNPFKAPASSRGENATAFRDFAFNVAMENAVIPGYMTEKIGFAFGSGSVPIYWGDTDTVNSFFNPASFLNVADYSSIGKAADAAVELWKDKQKLQRFLNAPITVNNKLADYEAIYTDYRPWQNPMVTALREAFPDLN